MKKQNIISIAIGILLIGGLIGGGTYFYYQQNQTKNETTETKKNVDTSSETNNDTTVSYNGKNGSTALELLQSRADVVTSGTGENAFVTSINGKVPNEKQYWAFYINDKAATVGAGSYVTKDSDTILWKLESF